MKKIVLNIKSMTFLSIVWMLSSLGLCAQNCTFSCPQDVNVSLAVSCDTEIKSSDLLSPANDCPEEISVVLEYNGVKIPTSPVVNASHIGLPIVAILTSIVTGQICSINLTLEDKHIPSLACTPTTISCDQDFVPIIPNIYKATVGNPLGSTCESFQVNINNETSALSDINIGVSLQSDQLESVNGSITTPDLTEVKLFGDWAGGVCGNQTMDLFFDQESAVTNAAFAAGCGMGDTLSGTAQPQETLNDLVGKNPNGAWSFKICHNATAATIINNLEIQIGKSGKILPFPTPPGVSFSASGAGFILTDFDGCGTSTLTYQDIVENQDCSVQTNQTIKRKWSVVDNYGNSSSCDQLISILRKSPQEVNLPPSFLKSDNNGLACSLKEVDPETSIIANIGWNALANGNPSPNNEYYPAPNETVVKWYGTGVPAVVNCYDLSFTYEDTRYNVCTQGASEGCFKIDRKWTALDPCTWQPVTIIQKIEVVDSTGPQILVAPEFNVVINSSTCLAEWIAPIPQISDNCSEGGGDYMVEGSEGVISQNANSQFVVSELPVGNYIFRYRTSDCCGNMTELPVSVIVEDLVPPTAVCKSDLNVSLNYNGTGKINASSFDDGSNDACGPVYFKVIRMLDLLDTPNGSNIDQSNSSCFENNADDSDKIGQQIYFDDEVFFCCNDLENEVMVVLRVFDRNPGDGPVNPSRMKVGGNLFGHFNDCMTSVFVEDKLAPNIQCPAPITLSCEENYLDISHTGEPFVLDNCSVPTVSHEDFESLNMCNVGTVSRVWTATDHLGFTSFCTQLITLVDQTTAIITFPDNRTIDCADLNNPAIAGQPEVIDNCDVYAFSKNDEVHIIPGSCKIKIIRHWTGLNWCTLETAHSTQILIGEDNSAPIISGVPEDQTISCEGIDNLPVVTAADECGHFDQLQFSESIVSQVCPNTQVIERTWTASDQCGNSSVKSYRLTISDEMAPVFDSIPQDMTLSCVANLGVTHPGITDNCDPDPNIEFNEINNGGDCASQAMITRVWTATDVCGNVNSISQIITFIDDIAPELIGIPADVTINCGDAIPAIVPVTVHDDCDDDIQIDFKENSFNNLCSDGKLRERIWSATDDCGNQITGKQTIFQFDNTAPVFDSLPVNITLNCDDDIPSSKLTATDNCSEATVSLVNIEVKTGIDCEQNFSITRTWSATDLCGNESTHSMTIFFEDIAAPIFTFVPPTINVSCEDGNVPSFGEPVVDDNCDNDVKVTVSEMEVSDCAFSTAITRTWTATDGCGNSSTAQQIVNISDTTPPTFNSEPANVTVECNKVPDAPIIKATDLCDPIPTVNFSEVRTDGACVNQYTLTRTWVATDVCNNSVTHTQTITVEDDIRPKFTDFPLDLTVECFKFIPNQIDTAPGGSDNCGGEVVISVEENSIAGNCPNQLLVTRKYTAEDICGNTSMRTQTIVVFDDTPPSIQGVIGFLQITCEEIPNVEDIIAIDGCDDVTVSQVETVLDTFHCFGNRDVERLYIATDACGNADTVMQTLQIRDTQPPMLALQDTNYYLISCDADSIIIPNVMVTDGCSPVDTIIFECNTDETCPGSYTLFRQWSAIDACGNSEDVQQRIEVQDIVAPTFDTPLVDITVPCTAIPDGSEVLFSDNCDPNSQKTFVDTRVDGNCPGNYSLIRDYTLVDGCGNVTRDTQMIMVIDTVAPTVFCADTITKTLVQLSSSDPDPGCTFFVDLEPTLVFDNCTPSDQIIITNDFIDDQVPGGSASGEYPIGFTTVTFTFDDGCGNSTTCKTVVEVIDEVKPSTTCIGPEIVVLDNTTGTYTFFLEDLFEAEDCELERGFFNASGDSTLTIDCDDLGPFFPVLISAVDSSNNTIGCFFPVNVTQSKNGPCPTIEVESISGKIEPSTNITVQEIPIYLDGTFAEPVMTDSEGNYDFQDVELFSNFTIRPKYNERTRDGVSTLDLVHVARHLIGLSPFESPYQWLAGDVDYSGDVNSFDLLAMQNLLLFNIDEFPNGDAWRFIAGEYEFENPDFPLAENIQETIEVDVQEIESTNKDFMAVKVGDVSYYDNLVAESSNRSTNAVSVKDIKLEAGTTIEIPIYINKYFDINGLQMNFASLNKGIQLTGIVPAQLDPVFNIKDQNLLVSWIDGTGLGIKEDKAIFKVEIQVNESRMLSECLTLSEKYISNELVFNTDQSSSISLEFATDNNSDVSADQELLFLFPNRPNPFKEETQVRFTLPESGSTVIEVTDITGRVLYRREAVMTRGYHEMILTSEELDSEGILYFKLITDHGTVTQTMLLVKK